MNKQQRKQLEKAQQMIDNASAMLNDIMEIIEEIKDNLDYAYNADAFEF